MSTATETKSKAKAKVQTENPNSQIVRNHVLMSMGVGAIPIPILDIAGITAINLGMIKKISKNHEDQFNKQIATNVISSLLAGMGAKSAATGAFGSLIKFIPVVGTLAGTVTYPAIAGATTYALGQVFIRHYEAGGTLLTLNTDSVKGFFNEQYEKGKTRVKDIKDAALGKSEK